MIYWLHFNLYLKEFMYFTYICTFLSWGVFSSQIMSHNYVPYIYLYFFPSIHYTIHVSSRIFNIWPFLCVWPFIVLFHKMKSKHVMLTFTITWPFWLQICFGSLKACVFTRFVIPLLTLPAQASHGPLPCQTPKKFPIVGILFSDK